MEIININPKNPEMEYLEVAIEVLKRGGVVAYPTDTVYGLGTNALRPECVERLFKIKKRPASKPVPVMIRDMEMAKKIAYLNSRKIKIMSAVWPGPVTVVVEKRNILPDNLTANQKTIGLRIPDYEITKLLMGKLNFPLTTTSCNLSGEEPISDSQEIFYLFKKSYPRPDLILDAGRLEESPPSTVLDLTGLKPKILRIGPVNKENLLRLLEM